MEPIKSILEDVLKNIKSRQEVSPGENIEDTWVRCVKKTIAQHTKACFLKQGKLYINVENPGWLFELKTKKEDILKRIKKLTKNKIKEITFRIGDIYGN